MDRLIRVTISPTATAGGASWRDGLRVGGGGGGEQGGGFVISRTSADAAFAAEIARVPEDDGHTVVLQQWDFANHNFIEQTHRAQASGARVIALLSPEYLASDHCQAEWQNAIAADPLNRQRRPIVLRIGECVPTGLLTVLAYWDLVPVRDDRALDRDIVRVAVQPRRHKSGEPPPGPYWRAAQAIVHPEMRETSSFTGCESELSDIEAALAWGGIGNAVLVREYADRHRDHYAGVWWLNAAAAGARAVLSLAASFAPDAIPEELYRQPPASYPPVLAQLVADPEAIDEAIGALANLSLIDFEAARRAFSVHRLVQTAARDALAAEAAAWAASALAVTCEAFPQPEFMTWSVCERLLPHVHAVTSHVTADGRPLAVLQATTADYLKERSALAEEVPLHGRALSAFRRRTATDPDNVALAWGVRLTLRRLGDVRVDDGDRAAR